MRKETTKLLLLLFVALFSYSDWTWGQMRVLRSGNQPVESVADATTSNRLDSLKQSYLDMGIPEDQAERRIQTIRERENAVQLRAGSYGAALPPAGSIWIDRDSITGAPNASHAHNFTPEEFVMDVFVKGGRAVAEQAIRNVTLISSSWIGSATDTWNDKGIMGPFGGDAGSWTSLNRELMYFDKGNTDSMEVRWNGVGVNEYFGIDKGLLLATGPALLAEAPNLIQSALGGGFTNWAALGGGIIPPMLELDPNLSPIVAPNSIGTLTSLEFDFRSYTDSVSFEFVFASEEYNNYSNSIFNDVFGFFVSGPGLIDEWGNTGDTINIARFPDGAPVTINNSNWGFRPGFLFADFDSLGATPVQLTGYVSTNYNAIRPEYHIPEYGNPGYTHLSEYDGRTIKLTAKVGLQRGVWYHMKLAISNTSDAALGSAIFLAGGSLDLGAPESNIPSPYIKTEYDSIYGSLSLYAGCENMLILEFDTLGTDRDVAVWTEGSGAAFIYDTDTVKYFKDTIQYFLPAYATEIIINFEIDKDVDNGSKFRFVSEIMGGGGRDTTDIYDLYAKSEITLDRLRAPTRYNPGILDISTLNGSPYMQRSLDGGITWEFARDTITGATLPFLDRQIANMVNNFQILYREPNTCCAYDTVFISWPVINAPIIRTVDMPDIPGVISSVLPGVHYVESQHDFVFIIFPVGENVFEELRVFTSRTNVSRTDTDEEGIIVVKNEDGSYTVTIRNIQESLSIYVNFTTVNAPLIMEDHVWTDGNSLYARAQQACEAQIYTVSGTLMKTVILAAGETTVTQLPKGFYIVNLCGEKYKVVIQ